MKTPMTKAVGMDSVKNWAGDTKGPSIGLVKKVAKSINGYHPREATKIKKPVAKIVAKKPVISSKKKATYFPRKSS